MGKNGYITIAHMAAVFVTTILFVVLPLLGIQMFIVVSAQATQGVITAIGLIFAAVSFMVLLLRYWHLERKHCQYLFGDVEATNETKKALQANNLSYKVFSSFWYGSLIGTKENICRKSCTPDCVTMRYVRYQGKRIRNSALTNPMFSFSKP